MISLEYILLISNTSHTKLADDLGIARPNVYRWFNGERKIPKKYQIILSARFEVPEHYFQKEITIQDKIELLEYEKQRLLKEVE